MNSLPREVICHMLCSVSPPDLVRLRRVSRQFYDLSHDVTIWRTLYANARLPRPPGPFPSQSIRFLERTLVQSEHLAHSWTAQPMGDVSTVAVRFPESLIIPPVLLYGRWFVSCESFTEFVVYDLDSDAATHSHQRLWESASPIGQWDVNPLVSASELLIAVVFRFDMDGPSAPWKLLVFRVNGDSIHLTFTLDVPTRKSDVIVYIDGGRSPFLHIPHQRLIFDAETKSFYEFPEFRSKLVSSDAQASDRTLKAVLLTKTHIIALFHNAECTASDTMPSTLLQAFTVPSDPHLDNGDTNVLRLSHEGIIPGRIQALDLIRNSFVTASGVTNIRFLRQSFEGNDLFFSCIDLLLPKLPPTDSVLPMTVEQHNLAHVNHAPFSVCTNRVCYVDSSDDGHMRGFWRFCLPHGPPDDFLPFPVLRFTIDASQERCVAVLGEVSTPQWTDVHDPPWSKSILFDPVRGRLFYHTIQYILRVDDYESSVVISVK